jgi:hypothetical protein
MLAMRDWAIYYDNNSTWDSEDGSFIAAPSDGVICIVRKQEDKTEFISGADYYIRFEDGTIIGTSDVNPLLRSLGWIKFGRYTSNTNQARIMERASKEWKHGS